MAAAEPSLWISLIEQKLFAGRNLRSILAILKTEGYDVSKVSKSTLNGHLNQRGAGKAKLASEKGSFQRWEQKHANALWQGDTSAGVWLPDPNNPNKRKRTKLISFIDDASRICTHAEFYWDEKLPSLVDCFRKALLKRGRPERLLCDNAFIYHSNTMRLMCAHLRVEVSFCKEYSPEGKGKVEKHYSTIKNAFYVEAEHAGLTSLHDLNLFFWAWLTKEYHHANHSSLKMTPVARWHQDEHLAKRVSSDDIRKALMLRCERRVNDRTALIRLENLWYQASPELAGDTVEVRWSAGKTDEIEIWKNGAFVSVAPKTTPSTNIDFGRKPERTRSQRGATFESSKNYRLALVNEHQGEAIAPPAGKDDYLSEIDFSNLFQETLQKPLDADESAIVIQFFHECSPLRTKRTTALLEQAVNAKGTKLHLRYYLEHIRRSTFQSRR